MSHIDLFTFTYQGAQAGGDHDGWHLFRAPTWATARRKGLDAHHFVNDVQDWLFEISHKDHYAGNGTIEGLYPDMPQAFSTGSAFCVKLRRLSDAVRFEQAFRVTGLHVILEDA